MTSTAHKLPVQQPTALTTPVKWNHQKYGSLADPVHKSHMSTLIGEYACTAQFRFDRIRELSGAEREHCSGKTEMGTAAHATIRRALGHPEICAKLLKGEIAFSPVSMRAVLDGEFAKATQGRDVVWYGKAEYEKTSVEIASMLDGLFRNLHKHVAEVVLAEAGWIAPVGKYWSEGHIDLVYRPRAKPTHLGIVDWKTGATKPHQIELDHGFESGLYSNALMNGLFIPDDVVSGWQELAKTTPALVPLALWDSEAIARAPSHRHAMHIALRGVARMFEAGEPLPKEVVRFGEFPAEIRLAHLADYVPYQKKGDKKIEREEELEHWSSVLQRPIVPGESVKYESGQTRGPAWYRVRRTEHDIKRLEKRLATIVGWVRLGLFVDAVGEKCTRCSYKEACLSSGYEARGAEAKQLTAAMKGLDIDDLAGGMEL